MRLFFVALLAVTGCAAPPETDPLELSPEPPRGTAATANTDGTVLPTNPTTPIVTTTVDARGCAADVLRPILCDSFEGAALGSAWTPVLDHGNVKIDTKRASTGAHGLGAGFGVIPTKGTAALETPVPADAPRVSLRMKLFLPVDGYPGRFTVAGLVGANDAGLVVAVKNGKSITIDDGGNTLASFDTKLGEWTCVSISVDRTNSEVVASLGKAVKTVAGVDVAFERAQVGMTYAGSANANASVGIVIDDVAIAESPLPCP